MFGIWRLILVKKNLLAEVLKFYFSKYKYIHQVSDFSINFKAYLVGFCGTAKYLCVK